MVMVGGWASECGVENVHVEWLGGRWGGSWTAANGQRNETTGVE